MVSGLSGTYSAGKHSTLLGYCWVMDRSDLPLLEGAVGGVLAYVLGYLVVYGWQAPSVRETLSGINAIIELVGGQTIPVWQAVGWLFYNAHAVPLQFPALGPGSASRSLIGEGGAASVLFIVPPVLLLLLGAGVAWWTDVDDIAAGAVAGSTILLGYVVLAAVGVFLFRYSIQDAFIGPALARGLLLAGILYPAVFGAIGGGLAATVR